MQPAVLPERRPRNRLASCWLRLRVGLGNLLALWGENYECEAPSKQGRICLACQLKRNRLLL